MASIEHVALTHMHWDHILGYPGFVWASWSAGRKRLRTIGPDGTEDMHERLLENYFHDQAQWATTVGYEPSGWDDVEVRDIGAGWSVELDGCVIDAAAVVHPPMVALAYRFTFGGRRLVISGDCAACDELVSLARSVDLLVADACAAAPALLPEPVRASLVSRLRGFHATPEECVEMATAAGVGHLVLTHLRKDVEPDIDDHQLGVDVTVGSDLQSFVV